MNTQFLHVTDVQALSGYRLHLAFNNGASGVVDLSAELHGLVFEGLRDTERFSKATLAFGTVIWPDDVDLAPEYLYQKLIEQGGVEKAQLARA